MEETKSKSWLTIAVIAAIVVLLAVVVIVLTSCGEEGTAPNDTAQAVRTLPPEETDSSDNGGSYVYQPSNRKTTDTKKDNKTDTDTKSPADPTPVEEPESSDKSGKTYGQRVRDDVTVASREYQDTRREIADAYDNGDVGGIASSVPDFAKGTAKFVGDVIKSVVGNAHASVNIPVTAPADTVLPKLGTK